MSLFDAGPIETGLTLADLLAIEDTAELLAPCCPDTGIPVWPNIRAAFLRQVMADRLFASGSIDPPAERRSLRAAGVFARTLVHNELAASRDSLRSDVLMNTEAIGDELRNGLWFNRYVDPFGDLPSGQAVVMTELFNWQWRTPRHNERIVYHTPIQAGAVLAGRLFVGAHVRRLATQAVDLACARAKALIGWEMDEARGAAFRNWTARKIAGLPFRYRAYRRLMRKVRPKLLLGSSHCYGIHAPLVAAARDLDIVVAEYQHGAISAGHDAYNFAPQIFASDAYRRTLPQYLLTYGSWWSAQVRAPVECVEIGYPARDDKLRQRVQTESSVKTILVLGDGIEFDLYLDLARAIAHAMAGQGFEVALRPHPMERAAAVERYGLLVDSVRIDVTPDIYASFRNAHTVVSEMSTGLFEAVGLVRCIIMLDTAKARFAFPQHPFTTASSIGEAIDIIRRDGAAISVATATELWAPDWRENYRTFLTAKTEIDV